MSLINWLLLRSITGERRIHIGSYFEELTVKIMSFDLDDGEMATERSRCESITNLSTGLDDDSNSSSDESVKVL